MPVAENAPGIASAVIKHTLTGVNVWNVLHLARADLTDTDPIPFAEVISLAEDVRDAWDTHVMSSLSSALVHNGTVVTDLTSATGFSATAGGTFQGAGGGAPLPNNCAACVSWPAGVRYRGGHARTYLAGIQQANAADSRHFTPSWLTGITTGMLDFAAAAPTGWQYVLLRRISGGVALTPPVPYVLGVPYINARIDSQRRRLGRV